MIPPMYELELLKYTLASGGIPPANAAERAELYLRYQFAVLITFWTTCMLSPQARLLYTKDICSMVGQVLATPLLLAII